MSVFSKVYMEANDLVIIFQNALCHTLAYTTCKKGMYNHRMIHMLVYIFCGRVRFASSFRKRKRICRRIYMDV